MNEALIQFMAFVAGCGLGWMFFGGLWWSVRMGLNAKNPAVWFLGSLLLRMSLALAGFCFVSGGHLDRLLLCLVGFVVGRLVVTHMTRASVQEPTRAP